MAWWETEPRAGSEKQQFQYDVARAKARRLAASLLEPGQATAAASLPPVQKPAQVQGGAFAQPTTTTAIPYSQQPVTQQQRPFLQGPEQKPVEMPAIYTPEQRQLGQAPWKTPVPSQVVPGETRTQEWLRRAGALFEGRVLEAWHRPTARDQAAEAEAEDPMAIYPPGVKAAALATAAKKPAEEKPAPEQQALAVAAGAGPTMARALMKVWESGEKKYGLFDFLGRVANTAMPFVGASGEFAVSAVGASILGSNPESEGMSVEQLYPLSHVAMSAALGESFWDKLQAPDQDSDSLGDLVERMGGAWSNLPQGPTPENEGVSKMLQRVKAGEDLMEVAADTYNPSAELFAQLILDPLNAFDVLEMASWSKLGKFGISRKYVTDAEMAITKVADSKALSNLAKGLDGVKTRRTEAVMESIAGVARAGDVSPEELSAITRFVRGTVGRTSRSIAMGDLNDAFKGVGAIFMDAKTPNEAKHILSQLLTAPEELAKLRGENVLGQQGQKARLILESVKDEIKHLPSMQDENFFNIAKFQVELNDLVEPIVFAAHGVKPPNVYQRFAYRVKNIMSEIYLSAISSPRYVLANFGVDVATGLFEGVRPGASFDEIVTYLNRFGPGTLRSDTTVDYQAAVRALKGKSFIPKWGPLKYLKRASEKSMAWTRHGVFKNIPIGEEPRYLAVLQSEIARYWDELSFGAMPDMPDALSKVLGPGPADDLKAAMAAGMNDAERRVILDRFLDAQNVGDGVPYTKYLSPEGMRDLSDETHQYLRDKFKDLGPDATVDDAMQVIDDAAEEQVKREADRRLAGTGEAPDSITDTTTAEKEIQDSLDGQLDEAADHIQDDAVREKAVADDAERAAERKRIEKSIDDARAELSDAAKEVEGPEGMEILMAAARDHDTLLGKTRQRMGELRMEVVADWKANPQNGDALWANYRIRVNSGWMTHAMERHQRMVEGVEHLKRFAGGEDLKSILGMDPRELEELRIAETIGDMPPKVTFTPGRIKDADPEVFEGYLRHQHALVDRARAKAWRRGMQVDPKHYKETIDVWNAAGYDIDVMGRQTAGRVQKRLAETQGKAEAALARKDMRAFDKFWEDYRVYKYDEWQKNTAAAETRWLKAQQYIETQEVFRYARPAPDIPTKPVQPGDKELAEAAAKKPKEAWTPEEQATVDRWTMKDEMPREPEKPPGTQPPLAAETPPPGVFTRDQFHTALRDVVGYTDEEVEATMRISDARAQTWAAETGRSPDEWYTERIAGIKPGAEFPDDEFLATFEQAEAKEKVVRGAVDFLGDGRAMIYAFEQADVSTIAHELGHIFRGELDLYDFTEVSKWAIGAIDGKWDEVAEEKFADGFVRYLAEGSAPSPELAKVFERFKQWLTDIYRGITGSDIDIELNDEVRGVFDRLLAEEPPARAGDIYGKELEYGRGLKAEGAARAADRHPLTVDAAMDEWHKYPEGEWGDWAGLRRLMEQRAEEYLRRSSPKDLDALAYKFSHGGPQTERDIELMGFPAKTTRKRGLKAERQFRRLFYEGYTSPKAFYNEQKAIGEWYLDLAQQAQELAEGKKVLTEITPPEWLKDVSPYTAPTEESLRRLYQKAPEAPEEIWTPKKKPRQLGMFDAGEDLPLFSGTAQRGAVEEFAPEVAARQSTLPGMEQAPEEILAADKAKTKKPPATPEGQQALFQRLQNTAEPWFYKARQLIDDGMPDQATADQVRSILVDGVKEDDLEWTGITRWLDAQKGTLNKEEVLSFLRGEQPLTPEDARSLFQKAQETNAVQRGTKVPGSTGDKAVAQEMILSGEQGGLDALDSLRRGIKDDWDSWQPSVVDNATRQGLHDWITSDVTPRMNDTRSTALQFGEDRANNILLDYTRQRGFDVGLSYIAPYHFWFTRTGWNWAVRFSRRPALLAHYLRVKDAMKRQNEASGKRRRFEDKVGVSAEWLPDWMGDKIYFDPFRMMLPFANIGGYNWDEPDDAAKGLRWIMNTTRKAGLRPYPFIEAPYQAGLVAKGAEGLGMEPEQAEQWFGPPREGEYGYALPQTGVIKGATAMAGIGPPGGTNIEAIPRQAIGLPQGEAWDPYRVTRMLANMMEEGPEDPKLAVVTLNAIELAERWGKQDQRGKPWDAQDLLATTTARELNWTPEALAAAQARLAQGMQRAAQERGLPMISSLYTGLAMGTEPTGERMQIGLQEEAGKKLWSPEQPEGTRESYDQFRRDYPAIYPRQAQYGTIPGEETEGFTPGQRGSWLARKEATEEINARYDAEMDVPGLTKKEQKAITGARYDELDQVKEQYPLPDMPEDMPAVRYGSSPEEAWDQLVEAELWDIKDSKPQPEDFMDGLQVRWTDYGDAVDEWEKSLPAAFGFGAVEDGKYAGMDPRQAYFLLWPKTTDTTETPDASEEETKEAKSGYAATSGRTWYNKQVPRPYYRSAGRRRAPIWTPRRTTYGGPFRG